MRRSGRSRPSSMPHRPAQPRIDPRRRRPDAFDQAAEDDAVGLRQPRFQRAVDAQIARRRLRAGARCGRRRRSGTLRDSRASCDRQAARLLLAEHIVEGGGQRDALRAVERRGDAVVRRATARSAPRDGAAPSSAKSCGLRCARGFPAAPAPAASRAISARAWSSSSSLSRARGSARCSEEVSPRFSLPSSSRNRRNRAASPSLAGGGRVPRSSASSSVSIARCQAPGARAEPQQRMLQQRQQRRRLQARWSRLPRRAVRKCRPACPSARRRRNRRMRDSSGPAPPSPAAPARGPASPAPRICPRCRASRIATAIASASISELAASITARSVMPAAICAATSGCCSRSMPLRGGGRRPHRLGGQHFASVRRRRAENARRRGA